MSRCDRCAFKKDSCHYTQTTGGSTVCSAGFIIKQKDLYIELPNNWTSGLSRVEIDLQEGEEKI